MVSIRDGVHLGLSRFGMLSLWDGVHSGWCPFGMVSIRDGVHWGWCPFGMVSIRDGVHSGLCPFGIVPIRDCAHSGLCSFGIVPIRDGVQSGSCSFGMVSIRDDVHSGLCPFGIVSIRMVFIRDCVHSGNCPDTLSSAFYFCTSTPKLKTSSRFENHPFSVTFSSTLVVLVKPESYIWVLFNKQVALMDLHLHLIVLLHEDLCAVRIFHSTKYNHMAFKNPVSLHKFLSSSIYKQLITRLFKVISGC